MTNLATTKMSSKGQIVIPEEIRKRLNLKTGAQFVVVGENDVVILKNITPPSIEDFDDLISKAKKAGKHAGLQKADIADSIKKVRNTK
ncbi:MAG: AbrB/MazE/SpoVT family DNA-binding domain-containing protein [Proteobacteria bacterium]|nr:AbrB/MazE/SpoVT family DNA-binding domain-containing protein [Pseudomonadota bacterium]MBU1386554.1 AbrB/MazE/SpoVT family DNA-binding domain-containing protein [Pseudomonadota bacterium]MBU1544665.1 AbrB/MazE/SpoVT family DNA-binding domain-containing protein [Pseudomonadota bacterium]